MRGPIYTIERDPTGVRCKEDFIMGLNKVTDDGDFVKKLGTRYGGFANMVCVLAMTVLDDSQAWSLK
ncbi:hypothetical protein ACLOJK_021512 [Asimina triloba]